MTNLKFMLLLPFAQLYPVLFPFDVHYQKTLMVLWDHLILIKKSEKITQLFFHHSSPPKKR